MSGERVVHGPVRSDTFTDFVVDVEPRLRRALIPVLGVDMAAEATAEALSYGWEHWDRVGRMDNPAGYLYRVARTAGKRLGRRPRHLPAVETVELPWVEPALPAALDRLSDRQRTVVWLVHGYGWNHTEVAALLGVSPKSIRTYLRRGTEKLARILGGGA